MQFYVDNSLGTGWAREYFYASSQVWAHYVSFVTSVINHWNPITGMYYKDDPTILAWELANEPHTTDLFELSPKAPTQFGDQGVTIGRGQLVGRLVNQWLCRAATLLKSLDPNHMVTTGEEGYRTNGPYLSTAPEHNWLNNGMKGVDFDQNIKCPDVDYMTLHVYPDNWNVPFWQYQFVIDNFITDRTKLAHAYNKPVVMEEYGCCKAADYAGKRGQVFAAFHDAADALGMAGTIVWQVVPWSGLKRDGHYDFTYDEDGGWQVKDMAKRMNAK
ncbi:hypothetical protein CHLRE_07g337750v5 [Chlamydomonas reinhardtii]|uniref:mannan endo-1,4-beta-mannosidase n=1 Tax=Chlamydomonas reinhardtii TaxID=3055 RepID=A0A2K3DK99_CHLRE|nr:uncharacterized protein CHLRE_07g337750v5 [Chlamydomonas reinhardtii]PNW80974.1 hypothetical protein CHLRE_07g337750v5 [Chlamydomonas reinhardtii]